MAKRTSNDNMAVVPLFDNGNHAANNTTVAGAAIDTQGFESVTFYADIGVWAETVSGGLIEIGVQHSDDTVSGNFTDITAADLTDSITATSTVSGAATGVFASVSSTSNDQKFVTCGYKGNKRYVRGKKNVEKNQTIGCPIAIGIIKGHASVRPTNTNTN